MLALSIVYYAVIYTIWLKPRTPQNIVIGGGAGAFPPLIGWIAVTGHITLMPVLLFAIIFVWTPPHFWALALFVKTDYAKVGIPMMPVVAGETGDAPPDLRLFGGAVCGQPAALGRSAEPASSTASSALVLSGVFLALAAPVAFRAIGRGRCDEAGKAPVRLFGNLSFRAVRRAGGRRGATQPWSIRMTPEEEEAFKRARKGRNVALALVLVGFVVLFYVITYVKLG